MDRFKKSLGQNFLTDKNIIKKLLTYVPNHHPILEIGTGNGNLTIELVKHTKQDIFSYEIDDVAYREAKERLKNFDNLHLFLEDFLTAKIYSEQPFIIVANIPYNITSPIIAKCLEIPNLIDIYLMVQKEMADRITAKNGTKDYSSFSIFCQTRATCKRLFNIPASCFIPRPKIDSSYIQLTPSSEHISLINNITTYNKIIKSSFWGKRKTLANCLQKAPYITFPKEKIFEALTSLNINHKIRGQELSVSEFIQVANLLS